MTKEIKLSESEIVDILRSHIAKTNSISVDDIVNFEIDIKDTTEHGETTSEVIAWAEILDNAIIGTQHSLEMVTVANGAGRGVCSCGWKSKVSDDRYMYDDDYYSSDDIKNDWEEHCKCIAEKIAQNNSAIATIQQQKESVKAKILMILNHLADEAIALGEATENRETKREKVTYIKHRIVDTLIKESTSNTSASQETIVNNSTVSIDTDCDVQEVRNAVEEANS